MKIAVNGTLMRGFELEKNMIAAGASFLTVAKTAPRYRLFSVDDRYPGMVRVNEGDTGGSISLEIWEVGAEGLVSILQGEPPGLSLGRVELQDGTYVFGVLAEPWVTVGKKEITTFGGWREYAERRPP
jgi:gamma-glutamylcyclotransferase (GGCT)/AIG2-like uncharacterized protein YtfP